MEINKEILNRLPKNARYYRAEAYLTRKRVVITNIEYTDKDNYVVSSVVTGREDNKYDVLINVKNNMFRDYDCSCQDNGLCKHIMATLLELFRNKIYTSSTKEQLSELLRENKKNTDAERKKNEEKLKIAQEASAYKEKYRRSLEILEEFKANEKYTSLNISNIYKNVQKKLKEEPKVQVIDRNIRIVPRISLSTGMSGELDFKIGDKQLYVLKDLGAFEQANEEKSILNVGTKLNLYVEESSFDEEAKKLLPLMLKYGKIIRYANLNSTSYYGSGTPTKFISINKKNIDEIMENLAGQHVILSYSYFGEKNVYVNSKPYDIVFEIVKDEDNKDYILINNLIDNYNIIKGTKNFYMLYGDQIYTYSKEKYEDMFKILNSSFLDAEIRIDGNNLEEFSNIVLAKIKDNLKYTSNRIHELQEKFVSKLGVKMYLDLDQRMNIVVKVIFCYNDVEINPFNDEENRKDYPDIIRNYKEENKIVEQLFTDGFSVDILTSTLVMFDEEAIYNLMQDKIEEYMRDYEVLATEKFNKREIKRPKLNVVGIKLESDLLNIDISSLNIGLSEIDEIMNSYVLKKRYHRLKSGEFVDLSQNDDLDLLNNLTQGLDIDFKKLESGIIKTKPGRSMYLQKILSMDKGLIVEQNDKYSQMIENIGSKNFDEKVRIPENFKDKLRSYQKTGYKWLKVLDSYGFGGILADDMGLGKSLQIIALIDEYITECKENNIARKTSIIVSPSSLVLNWKNEIEKWTDQIKVKIISGKSDERKDILDSIEKYDLIVTSYDLLKRDVEYYEEKNYIFKYLIADEAQYIKNMTTKNAKSLKTLDAETRYALTGTPIENSISELWSIFDYIMPGYLYSYNKFKERYEVPIIVEKDEKAMDKLKMLIDPFVLRRVKREVLTELPDKNITILANDMEEKQEKIYLTYLANIKNEVADEISKNGLEKSQIKILSLLTRLRQICCHPSLFIENYDGESSKLNQCMELINGAIDGGHKILLFSQYTSMFEIIEEELKKNDIEYLKLTGQTKVDQRVQMVDEFNTKENIKVFLISLKAGGTGLNLVGADVVIHYDPWWNLSAENQATDRAYRIGQKNSVQVYKLITSNSIEEKINKLQMEKGELSDALLSTEETFINRLSKEEIMKLFE